MDTEVKLRILEIGHDPWIGPRHAADFFALGAPLAPNSVLQQSTLPLLSRILWRLFTRRYDVIALGPIHVQRTIGLNWKARILKKIVSAVAASDRVSWLVRRLCFGNAVKVVIFDIDDRTYLSEAAFSIFRPLIYFKRNLLKHDRWAGTHNLQVMPMAIQEEFKGPNQKETDLFVCGAYSTEARKAALNTAQLLGSRGWRVDIVEKSIPYQEYRERLARSRLAFCFQGCGYHTWRMYEAAFSSTVPLIDPPPPDLIHDFVDGENCVIMKPSVEEMVIRVDGLLRDRQEVARIAVAAHKLAYEKHTRAACSAFLLKEITRAMDKEKQGVSLRAGAINPGWP